MQILIGTQENTDLNKKLEELSHKEEFTIPFHTFGWRNINFDRPILLGVEPYQFDDGQPYKQFVGLLGHSRHGYKSWYATSEQSLEIKKLCQDLVKEGTAEACNKLTDYLQTCKEEIHEDQSNTAAGS